MHRKKPWREHTHREHHSSTARTTCHSHTRTVNQLPARHSTLRVRHISTSLPNAAGTSHCNNPPMMPVQWVVPSDSPKAVLLVLQHHVCQPATAEPTMGGPSHAPVAQSPGISHILQKPRMWSMRYAWKYCDKWPRRRFHLHHETAGSKA